MNGRQTNGNFFESAILNDEWAKPAIDCPTPCTLKTLQNQWGTRTDFIGVIHRECHAFTLEIIHIQRGRCASVLWRIYELELARARRNKVRRTVLVAKRMAADHDRFDPSGYGPRDALEDDRLAEDGATEDIADLGRRGRGGKTTSAKGAMAKTERMERGCRKRSGSAGTDGRMDGRC